MPETPTRFTPTQRVVLWILNALMFYVVVLYPVFLMAAFEPDDVVHYGFLRWMAVVLVLYWGALQLFFTERPAEPRVGRMLLAIFAVLLLLLGTFTPIVSFPFVGDVDFFRAGYADGYVLLILTALSLALAVTGRWKQVLVPALGSLAVVLWTFLGVQDTVADARSGSAAALAGNPHEGLAASVIQSIQWEWGWLLLFAGSGLLVYSAARKDRPEPEYPPLVSVTAEDEYGSAGEAPAATDAAQASAPAAGESAPSGQVTTEQGAVSAEASEADSAPVEQAEAPMERHYRIGRRVVVPDAPAEQAAAPEPAAASSAEVEAGSAETAATAKPETGATEPAETAAGAIGAAAETSARASGEAAPTAGVDEPGTGTAEPTDEPGTATEAAPATEDAPAAVAAGEAGTTKPEPATEESAAGADETVAEAPRSATASAGASARQPEAAAAEPAAQEVESTTAGPGAPPKPAPADAGATGEARTASTQAEATAEPGNATEGAVTAAQPPQAAASESATDGEEPASGAKKE